MSVLLQYFGIHVLSWKETMLRGFKTFNYGKYLTIQPIDTNERQPYEGEVLDNLISLGKGLRMDTEHQFILDADGMLFHFLFGQCTNLSDQLLLEELAAKTNIEKYAVKPLVHAKSQIFDVIMDFICVDVIAQVISDFTLGLIDTLRVDPLPGCLNKYGYFGEFFEHSTHDGRPTFSIQLFSGFRSDGIDGYVYTLQQTPRITITNDSVLIKSGYESYTIICRECGELCAPLPLICNETIECCDIHTEPYAAPICLGCYIDIFEQKVCLKHFPCKVCVECVLEEGNERSIICQKTEKECIEKSVNVAIEANPDDNEGHLLVIHDSEKEPGITFQMLDNQYTAGINKELVQEVIQQLYDIRSTSFNYVYPNPTLLETQAIQKCVEGAILCLGQYRTAVKRIISLQFWASKSDYDVPQIVWEYSASPLITMVDGHAFSFHSWNTYDTLAGTKELYHRGLCAKCENYGILFGICCNSKHGICYTCQMKEDFRCPRHHEKVCILCNKDSGIVEPYARTFCLLCRMTFTNYTPCIVTEDEYLSKFHM